MRKLTSMVCGVGLALVSAWPASALTEKPAEKKGEMKGDMAAAHQHEMGAEEKAMMDAYMKAGAPGKEQAGLAKTAGKWEVTSKMWMAPGAPPTESKGKAERAMVLGGRVLTETFHGEVMGAPFEGHGMTGYDNVTGKYWGTWNDTMTTGVMTSTGTCDEGMITCTFVGTTSDPISGKAKTIRMVSKTSGDQETFEMWEPTPDGKEFKSMELTYIRKK